MSKLNCNVVRDILPLYADEVVCDDTKELVEEHLTECDGCRNELFDMRSRVVIPVNADQAVSFKKVTHRWTRKQFFKGAGIALAAAAVLIGVFFYLYGHGLPVKAADLTLADGLQCNPELNENGQYGSFDCPTERQVWVIDIGVTSGEVRENSEFTYGLNENGEQVVTGVIMYIRRSPIHFPWNGSGDSFRTGYGLSESDLAVIQDFTFTIVCADQEFTYSMREEGVFDPPTGEHSAQFCPYAD